MAILLTILKVIGIILLCILGLLLLIVLLALFSPITYNVYVTGSKEGKSVAVKAKLGWFLYLIRPVAVFENNELSLKVRVFGIPINLTKNEDRGRVAVPESPEDSPCDLIASNQAIGQRTVPVSSETEEIPVSVTTESSEEVEIPPQDEPVDKKKSIFDKIKSFFKRDKKKKLTEEEKEKLKEEKRLKREETKKKVEETIAKVKKFWAFLKEEETKKAIALVKDVLKKTIRHILPRRFKGHINLGMEDPSTTGTILAACGAAYPVHKGNFLITPIFDTEELVVDGEARVKGHIFLIFFVIQGIRILRNKRIMGLIKKARK